jgi:hypothetical protein
MYGEIDMRPFISTVPEKKWWSFGTWQIPKDRMTNIYGKIYLMEDIIGI